MPFFSQRITCRRIRVKTKDLLGSQQFLTLWRLLILFTEKSQNVSNGLMVDNISEIERIKSKMNIFVNMKLKY